MSAFRIENARVLDPASGFDGVKAITVRDGRIVEGGSVDRVIDGRSAWLSPGLVDVRAIPRSRDDFSLALQAGVTTVCCSPESQATDPRLQVLHATALVRGTDGAELGEIADGATCVSTGFAPVPRAGVFRRALQYLKPLQLPVLVHAEVASIAGQGVLGEGPTATRLGLAAVPVSAETAAVAQLLEIVREIGTPVHFSHVTTARSLALITRARAEGVPVSCDVSVNHLTVDTAAAEGFSLNARVWPPLRSRPDVEALQSAVRQGEVDVISFDHVGVAAIDREHAFAQSAWGAATWARGMGPLLALGLPPLRLMELLTLGPARVLNRPTPSLALGQVADLCLLHPQTGKSALTVVAGRLEHQSPLE